MDDNEFPVLTPIRLLIAILRSSQAQSSVHPSLLIHTDRSVPPTPVDLAKFLFTKQLKPQLTTHANQGLKIIPSGRPSGPV